MNILIYPPPPNYLPSYGPVPRVKPSEKLGLNSNEIKTFALRVKPQQLKDENEFR